MANYVNIVSSERIRIENELKSRDIRFFNSAGNFICLPLPTLERAQLFEADMQKVGHLLEIHFFLMSFSLIKCVVVHRMFVRVSVWVNGRTCHLVRLQLDHSNVTI